VGCGGTPVRVWTGQQYRRVLKDELVSAALGLFVLNETRDVDGWWREGEKRKERRRKTESNNEQERDRVQVCLGASTAKISFFGVFFFFLFTTPLSVLGRPTFSFQTQINPSIGSSVASNSLHPDREKCPCGLLA